LNGWIDEFGNELALKVLEEELLCSDSKGFLTSSLKVLFLTYVGHECVDFVPFFNEPSKDA
jgi:hypothetical protein